MLKNTQKLVCDKISSGERLDIFLSKKINSLTRSNIKNIIKSSNVKINGDKIFSQSKKIKENKNKLKIKIKRERQPEN